MERIIHLQIERLPEGMYLATTEDIQGLVAQGRTVAETLEFARDVARKLLDEQQHEAPGTNLPGVPDSANFAVVAEA